MGLFKRLSYYLGLVFGLGIAAAALAVALTYLFTGKIASIESNEGNVELTLMTAEEVVQMVREQVEKAKTAGPSPMEGEHND